MPQISRSESFVIEALVYLATLLLILLIVLAGLRSDTEDWGEAATIQKLRVQTIFKISPAERKP
jgi:hypothetical protein